MTLRIAALVLDSPDPARAAAFWGGVMPEDGLPFPMLFVPGDLPKLTPNQLHFDIPSRSWDDQAAIVEQVLAHGGHHLDIGQLPEEEHVVMADPDGNEFCVIEPGNDFLTDTGWVGCLSSDGSAEVGRFWAAALGWTLVWDQDEETAIQSPAGGLKISWGGPPYNARAEKNRFHLDLAASDLEVEVARLEGLGAQRIASFHEGYAALADPDGNPFCVTEDRPRIV